MVCSNMPPRGGEPQRIGVIIASSPAKCVACDKFETCDLVPAMLARVALEMSLRAAARDAKIADLSAKADAVRKEMKRCDDLMREIDRDMGKP